MKFPPLGNPAKTYPVELTEPEINSIYGAAAFLVAMQDSFKRLPGDAIEPLANTILWLQHYLPTLKSLSERLEVFDDGQPTPEP